MSEDNQKRPGPKKGRRPVIYICAGIVNGALVCEERQVKDQDPDSNNGSFPSEIAISAFRQDHGIDPEKVLGPLFEKKGAKKAAASRKKISLDRDNIDQYTLAAEHKKAQYGEWTGLANLCTNDDSKAFFIPLNKVDPEEGKKVNPPAAGIVDISHLTFEDNEMSQETALN